MKGIESHEALTSMKTEESQRDVDLLPEAVDVLRSFHVAAVEIRARRF
jgi:hypothetical protein